MPPAAKATKKTGAPRTKGAVRAKSGCYTCRIRRKKCDERPDTYNRCETCVRLKLECLGFGAKRPEWLRENTNVLSLREKIKDHLAKQGLIKGHSGSGPRSQDEAFLRLSNGDYSSSSESPPTQTLSLSSADEYPRSTHHLSSVREEEWAYHRPSQYDSSAHATHTPPREESPFEESYSEPSFYTAPLQPTSNSLVPWNPAISSRFSPTYHMVLSEEQEDEIYGRIDAQDLGQSLDPLALAGLPSLTAYSLLIPLGAVDQLVAHYVSHVVPNQYLLADMSKIHKIINASLDMSAFSRDAARLLAAIDTQRRSAPQRLALQLADTNQQYIKLLEHLGPNHVYDDHTAMAALHVISSFLFDGGSGDWEDWLRVACTYADTVLSKYRSASDALLNCTDTQRFLIKTVIWFDVLASITTLKPPFFLQVILEFCDPNNTSHIYDPDGADEDSYASRLSMMTVMGCENHVVWALARTSELAWWKQDQMRLGCLSVPELARQGQKIERLLSDTPSPTSQRPPLFTTTDPELALARSRAAEIFRAAALVYLRSVISGDHPDVPDIAESVNDTVRCLRELHQSPTPKVISSVVRSTVFAVFMCGCLTNDSSQRRFLRDQLGTENGPGNCASVAQLLDEMTQYRKSGDKNMPVPWRQRLHDRKMLLV